MYRIFFALVIVVVFVMPIVCQETETDWRQHVIPDKDRFYNFKTVAKGTMPVHRFVLRNPLVEPMHIGEITTSCSCTSLDHDEKKTVLQTYEEFVIPVKLRGDMLTGEKNATITVTLDKPKAEILLNIKGEIRDDLSVTPDFIDFENVELGTEVSKTLKVTYRGNNTRWFLAGATCENKAISADTTLDTQRSGVNVKVFVVNVTLDKSAPNGVINTHLVLISNDAASRREIPIPIRVAVGTVVTVTPVASSLGILLPGEKSSAKSVLISGKKPFRITKIECDNPAIEILPKIDSQAKPTERHPLVVSYQNPADGEGAPDTDSTMRAEVRITTDVPDLAVSFYVTANVRKKEEKDLK